VYSGATTAVLKTEGLMTEATSFGDVLDRQDADELLRLLDAGADVNELTSWGSLLTRTILAFETHPRLHDLVKDLLRHGADPRLLKDRGGPLFAGVIIRDTAILCMLLEAGAQPNEEWDPPESLYDWAEFDYQFEEYGVDLLPEDPTPPDRESADAWLDFLEPLAITFQKRPPDYLSLLRKAGAKRACELEREGAAEDPVRD
jgi:ankyrin repeat protein